MNGKLDDIDLVRASGAFDQAWYLDRYPDVAGSGLEPVEHYLRIGARLLRDPGPGFSTQRYLQANPDVAAAGVNALVHFIRHGAREGRVARPMDSGRADPRAVQVDVVVPVYNALDDVRRCLQSLVAADSGCRLRIILVNDASDADTTLALREFQQAQRGVELIEHPSNLGYTRAVNAGLRATSAPYVVTLNSDTIVTPGWLASMVRCMTSDPRLGIVGPLSNAASWQNVPALYDEEGRFAINALPEGASPEEMARLVAAASQRSYPRLPFVNGFCFMIRREVIHAIGYMDEAGFPSGYGEENDYCIRAADAGFQLAIADDAFVFHAKSRSFGHERRKQLSAQGTETLRRKHGAARFAALVERVKRTADLDRVRARVQAMVDRRHQDLPSIHPLRMAVLFLLPVDGVGGGVHSIVQEVVAMRRLGVTANVAVLADRVEAFIQQYQDVPDITSVFVGFQSEDELVELAGAYDVVAATIYSSMRLAGLVRRAHPHVLPAYYVQDYEPLFFAEGSPNWRIARESYDLVPGALLFAKTQWIIDTVGHEHGCRVEKVQPSLDHDTYRPGKPAGDGLVHVVAMIRPSTPRRGAERTMRLFEDLARRHPGRFSFELFGCADSDPRFQALPRGFPFRNHGVLSRPQVAALLGRCDVFVDLSDYQAFGRTGIEALACGCALVITRNGGVHEYAVDGVNALLVDPHDELDCLTRFEQLATDPDRLVRMQAEGLRTASRFSVQAAAMSELGFMAEALSRHRRMHPRPSRLAKPKLPLTVLVITWDVGHNPLGRSYMLAEVLDRVATNVVTMGFQFPRYGEAVWEPLREARLPIVTVPGRPMPGFLDDLEKMAGRIRPDVVVACKARLPSLQLAALVKEKFGCPLVVDVDDHELSFFNADTALSVADLAALPDGALAGEPEPYGETWTRLAQDMCKYADAVLVSSEALQKEFGGTVLPHVRDEQAFDPARRDRRQARRRLGIPEEAKVVLFFGTARAHKGIEVLATAVGAIEDPAFKLVVVGSAMDARLTARLQALAPGRVIQLPNQPFSSIPDVVCVADVVCLPQDPAHPVSRYQLPAKAIDAIAMGVPLLVSATEPMLPLVQEGLATLIDPDALPQQLRDIVAGAADDAPRAASRREAFERRYSHAAAAETLHGLLSGLVERGAAAMPDLQELLAHQRRLLPASVPPARQETGTDIVVFWKQNDSGLYGRRSDMVIRYLASRPDVRRVVVFDAACWEHALTARRRKSGAPTHDRMIYRSTYQKILGGFDTDKVSVNVFVHRPGREPFVEAHAAFVRDVLEREGVDSRKAVFWLYPKLFRAPSLLRRLRPARVVVDVVDDHREWPGQPESEIKLLTENYRTLLGSSDMALANCQTVAEAMRPFAPGIRLVPNGCDRRPPIVEPLGDPAYRDFLAWQGKTIGFVGNLEPKVDIALIARLAEAFPDCRVVLLGSTHTNPEVLALRQRGNVVMPGAVPYENIGAWVSRFDVGIIPHLDMPMTRSMNPLKLYVYLAWGVPVVTTEVRNVDTGSGFVRVGASHDAFIRHVADVLADGPPGKEGLEGYLEANSWEARLRPHVDELLASLGKKRGR